MKLTSSPTRPVTSSVTSRATGAAARSKVRITLTGGGTSQWDIQYPAGTSLRTGGKVPMGYNLGVFEYYSEAEATAFIAQLYSEGVRLVRLVGLNRTFGSPGKGSGDSNRIFSPPGTDAGLADACYNRKNPKNWHKLKVYARAIEAISKAHPSDPMWFIVCMEGDVKQCGTQDTSWNGSFRPTLGTFDRALTLVQASETIPGALADWGLAGGYSAFTSNVLFGQMREEAKMIAREFRSYDYVFAYEFQPEPMPASGKFPNTPVFPNRTGPPYLIYPGSGTNGTNGTDGVYGADWIFRANNPNAPAYLGTLPTTGPPHGCRSLEELYRTLIADTLPIDGNTPYIVGGRGAYNLDPELYEVIAALSDSTGVGGNLVAKNIIIGTWDRLGSGVNQCTKTPNVCWDAVKTNCPVYQNGYGERNTSDGQKDPGDPLTYGIRHTTRAFRQWGIPACVWDRRGNGVGGYGTEGSNGDGDGDGAGGTYTVVEPRRTDIANAFAETLASLETAAIAAATAANGVLVYVKADRSNCTKVGGGIPAVGDAISQINPVTDPQGTGIVFTLHASGTVKVDLAWKDGNGVSYLPDQRPVLAFDNIADINHNSMLDGSISYFGATASGNTATGDETYACIFAGLSTAGNGVAFDFVTCGNSGTTVKYPNVGCNGSNIMLAKLIGDGPSGPTLTAANTSTWSLSAGVPIVATLIKSGLHSSSAVTLLVNGIDDTAPAPGGIGTGETTAGTGNTLTGQTVANTGIASLTRLRIGGSAAGSNAGSFTGVMAGWCFFRQAPTAAQYHAIGRFFAALIGGGYKA